MTELWTPPGPAPQPPWPGPDVTPFVPWDVAKDGRMIFMARQNAGTLGAELVFLNDCPPGSEDQAAGDFVMGAAYASFKLKFGKRWMRREFIDTPGADGTQFIAWLRAHCEYVVPF